MRHFFLKIFVDKRERKLLHPLKEVGIGTEGGLPVHDSEA
jgi:hypothetical protein